MYVLSGLCCCFNLYHMTYAFVFLSVFESVNDTNETVTSFALVPESSRERYLQKLCSAVLEHNKADTTEGLKKVLALLSQEKVFTKDVMLGVLKPTVLELNDLAIDFPTGI